MHKYTSLITQYFEGWVEGSAIKILATLSDNIKIVEGQFIKGKRTLLQG